jgi:hypothetical protein
MNCTTLLLAFVLAMLTGCSNDDTATCELTGCKPTHPAVAQPAMQHETEQQCVQAVLQEMDNTGRVDTLDVSEVRPEDRIAIAQLACKP